MDAEKLEAFRLKYSSAYNAFKKRYITPELTFEKVMIHAEGTTDDPEVMKSVHEIGPELFEKVLRS